MDPKSNGCRLCLDPFAECFTTIDNPQLKDQMETVFCFSIEPKQGYCSGVCQSCSCSISEFYQYSEIVRQNQEVLNGNVTNCDPTLDSKVALESVKVETLSDSGFPETTEGTCAAIDEVLEKEKAPTEDSKIILENVKVETFSDSRLPKTTEDACEPKDEVSEEEGSFLDSKITIENINVETLSDSGLPETTEDACAVKDDVSEEVPNSDDELYESPSKNSETRQKGYSRKRKHDIKTQEERDEEDLLFGKHFSMICDLCDTSAATYTQLVSHFKKEHKRPNGYLVCCNKKLFNRCAILDHIDFHADPDVFRCEVCGCKYKNKDTLNKHILFKHPNENERPFKCDNCPHSFAQESALAKHMKRHVKVKCPKCSSIFNCKRYLKRHMARVHSDQDRTIVCDTCGKGFLCKRSFDRHKNEHKEDIKVQRIQCVICNCWLKSVQSLQNHIKWVHTEANQQVQCDICQQSYPHSQALSLHKSRTHEEPKHECEFCGKKFKKAITLKEHRTIHTGEVLYSCKYCGIPSNRKKNLYQHVQRQHPTELAQINLLPTRKSGPSSK